jgi:hypothetical protein
LGAESSLINNESSNRHGQPRMGTALTSEWWLSHEWANASEEQRRLWNANKGTLWRWSIKEGGTYISNQVRMHACHLTSKHCTYFWVVTGRSSMKSSKIVDKERIIELMITKNRFRSWNEKRMRWTLLVGESQRNKEINPVIKRSLQVNPAIRKRRLSALSCQDFACQVFLPCKSHFSIWVGHPS